MVCVHRMTLCATAGAGSGKYWSAIGPRGHAVPEGAATGADRMGVLARDHTLGLADLPRIGLLFAPGRRLGEARPEHTRERLHENDYN
jgi:hypothetical protein